MGMKLKPAGHVPSRSGNPGAGSELNPAFGGQSPNSATPKGMPYTPTPRGGMPEAVDVPKSGGAPFTTGEKGSSNVVSTPPSE